MIFPWYIHGFNGLHDTYIYMLFVICKLRAQIFGRKSKINWEKCQKFAFAEPLELAFYKSCICALSQEIFQISHLLPGGKKITHSRSSAEAIWVIPGQSTEVFRTRLRNFFSSCKTSNIYNSKILEPVFHHFFCVLGPFFRFSKLLALSHFIKTAIFKV